MYALKNFVPLLRTAQRALMIQWQQTRHVDYYSALGVSLQSDVQEIKVAYFRLAKRYHPDHNRSPDAESMFELVSEAYEVLSDPVKRKNFDEYGTAGETFGGSTAKGPGRKKGDKTFTSEDLFDRIFKAEGDKRSLFGTEQAYHDGSEFGHDSTKDLVLTVTFEEAAKGCLYSLQFNQKVVCYKCFGSKSEMGYQGNTCPYCEGTGLETEKVGHITTRRACSYCDGSRIFIKFKCHECCGTGVTVAAIPIM
jgi:DnaJ-class molecular chaperone